MNGSNKFDPKRRVPFAGLPAGDHVARLLAVVRQLGFHGEPAIRALTYKIACANDQSGAEALLKRLHRYWVKHLIEPDRFQTFDTDLDGPFRVCQLTLGVWFGLGQMDLARHVGIFGQSGTGKSNLLRILIEQAHSEQIHVVHIDRKSDLAHLAREGGVDCLAWDEDRDNSLCPPDEQINIREYASDLISAFAELNGFMQRGTSIFALGLDALYRQFEVYEHWGHWPWGEKPFPTWWDLRNLFASPDFVQRIRAQGRESLYSIIDKLDAMLVALGPVLRCQRGYDMGRWYLQGRVINLIVEGLSVEHQNFLLITKLIKYAHYFKANGPRGTLNVIFVVDECKSLFGARANDLFILTDLISKCREWGIGIVAADQMPSQISQSFFSNIGTLVLFRHSDGRDLERVRVSSGATREQIAENYGLRPGECIVRTMKCKDLVRGTVPFTEVEKFIPRLELNRLMAPRLAELRRDVIEVVDTLPMTFAVTWEALGDRERAMLAVAAEYPDVPGYVIYKRLQLSSGAGHRVKTKLLAQGLLTEVKTTGQGGKPAKCLVPIADVYEILGIELPAGRGKALHRHLQGKIQSVANAAGFEAVIEDCPAGTSEGADVGLTKDGRRIAVEVCVTSKPQTECDNVTKNLRLGYDYVILTFLTSKALKKTQALVKKLEKSARERATLCLITTISEVIGGV